MARKLAGGENGRKSLLFLKKKQQKDPYPFEYVAQFLSSGLGHEGKFPKVFSSASV
jgi:hypothetical protein